MMPTGDESAKTWISRVRVLNDHKPISRGIGRLAQAGHALEQVLEFNTTLSELHLQMDARNELFRL
jgi:hypothetical protein